MRQGRQWRCGAACSPASVKGESELSESIKHRCHGNRVSTLEGHKMERAFPSCWEAVKNDTQLKPHTASFKNSLSQRAFFYLCRRDFAHLRESDVCFWLYLYLEIVSFLSCRRYITLTGFYFGRKITNWKAQDCVQTHTSALIYNTLTSQQVHGLIKVFPAVWRGSVRCRHHLPQLHQPGTHKCTQWANAARSSSGQMMNVLFFTVCPPFVNRVMESHLLHPGSGCK